MTPTVSEDTARRFPLVPHGRDVVGSFVARRQSLTPERGELIRALRAEYELLTWKMQLRIEPDAARALLDAGWDYPQAGRALGCFETSRAETRPVGVQRANLRR